MSQKKGFAAEDHARQYLLAQGLQLVANNYRCRCGEIDLIMRDDDFLVFIEVRSRSNNAFGGAVASVTHEKRKKLIKTALFYLQAKNLYDKYPTRFDLLSFDGNPPTIAWIRNAFGADF